MQHKDLIRKASRPVLSNVVVACLSVGGAYDTHAVAGLDVSELQQHHGQIVDEELRVHQGHGKLDDPVIVLILGRPRVERTCFSGDVHTVLVHLELPEHRGSGPRRRASKTW